MIVLTLVAANGCQQPTSAYPRPLQREHFHMVDKIQHLLQCDRDKRATKLPTFLEGETLAVWLDLSTEERNIYVKELVLQITPNTIEQF